MAAAAALVVGAGLFLGVRWAVYGRFIESTDNAYVKADTIVISAKTPGRVQAVYVADNSAVSKGDPLVRIESDDYSARVRQGEADLEARRAALETLDRQTALNQANIDDARASIKSAEASRAFAARNYERYSSLANSNVASKQKLDETSTALKSAEAQLESANASLAAASAEAAVIAAQKQEARAALARAEATLDLAEIDETNVLIRAPADGVVGNVSIRTGEYASTGRQMMALVPVSDAYIVANFKETQVERIRAGERVKIEIDAYPGAEVIGAVDSLSPASGAEFSLLPPENATGNFTKIVQRLPVKVRVVEAPAQVALLPGMSVTATVDTRGADLATASLFAPRSAKDALASTGNP